MAEWIEYLTQVQEQPRQWLWPQRIPLGELTLIAGQQGLGKSLLVTKLTANITRGELWPDGTECAKGDVVLLSAEDSVKHTIKPRHIAAGANLDKVQVIHGIPRKKSELIPFTLNEGMDILLKLAADNKDIRAIVIDPIGSYVGAIDIHRENQVRKVMFDLKMKLAEPFGIAVILVVHLRKGGQEDSVLSRVMGSVAFTAAARAAWVVCACKEVANRRKFLPIKHNLTAGVSGYEYFIETAPNGEGVAQWGEPLHEVAEDAISDQGLRAEGQRGKAEGILKQELSSGPREAAALKEILINEGVSWRTANTAKKALKIKSFKANGIWHWELP